MGSKVINHFVTNDTKLLHKISEPVDYHDSKLTGRLYALLHGTYRKMDGKMQGLAAIQIGLPYRAVLIRWKKGLDPFVAFNPRIVWKIGSKKSNEGCLSEGDTRYIVKRPRIAKIEWRDSDDNIYSMIVGYKKARIFCHEVDHLNGVLLSDIGEVADK